jgi:hypothetical protein
MNLAAAVFAGHLAARATDRRFRTTEAEIQSAQERAVSRRTARITAAARHDHPVRGRHLAPRTA